MAIDVMSASAICSRCGRSYGRRKGNFPVNYGALYKGVGYLSVCKNCVDDLYNGYLSVCKDPKMSVRQVCRKLDLFWSDSVYEVVSRKSTQHTMMTAYISKINTITYSGKSYDDTLLSEGDLWSFSDVEVEQPNKDDEKDKTANESDVSPELIDFWGPGLDSETYDSLQKRWDFWMNGFENADDLEVGETAIIKQICFLEVDIAHDRIAGRSVDKSLNTLNNLIGAVNLKPTKQVDSNATLEGTPFGVWIKKFEDKRPIPDVDPELEDVDGIIRYISIWFLGHLCKMLGIKNGYCKMYEDAIAELSAERPEIDNEDDEAVFNDIFNSDSHSSD